VSDQTGADPSAKITTFFSGILAYYKKLGTTARAVWFTAIGLVLLSALWGISHMRGSRVSENSANGQQADVQLPSFSIPKGSGAIFREAVFDTVIPKRQRVETLVHTVAHGDSIFSLARDYDITPETILWANYDQLNDNPDLLEPGMQLNIPPVDGVYYQWQQGDTLEKVAKELDAKASDILDWPGNEIDLVTQDIPAGTWVMVPGGQREFRQWVIPTINRGHAGVSTNLYGGGTCEGGYTGANGTGSFVWPSSIHEVVGNDYWSGHLAIDIATTEGMPVYASDSGVVVFAGWATGGYGYMIMIDHGNDYSTLYAHLSQVSVNCGNSVVQGQTIGYGGSTGNSTGPHLHFEVRYQDGFTNPWYVLP